MTRIARIEAWADLVTDHVKRGAKVEDSRVELKSEWPDPKKAARRLAGHANAAAGSQLMWLIGVDEKTGVTGANSSELADWWRAVEAEFDGICPSLTDVTVRIDGKTVHALAFDTTRPPYVVKNPDGGKIQFEVPWREGTSIRSARRSELLRILLPTTTVPEVEVLRAYGSASAVRNYPMEELEGYRIAFSAILYITPRDGQTVIPFHRCRCTALGSNDAETFDDLRVTMALLRKNDGSMLSVTENELMAGGPGACSLHASSMSNKPPPGWMAESLRSIRFSLAVVDVDLPISIDVPLVLDTERGDENLIASWKRAE